ncbi:MAG: heme NO-binding domain-containing protein [Verrucomicrobiota bacterium]
MYGMVNQAIEQMLSNKHGAEAWRKIKLKAGVEEEVFISNQSYPDEMTYGLISAAQECLDVPAASILEELGEFWVLETAQRGYGHLMKAGGKDFPEFIHNLPNFHARIMLIFPALKPPVFKVNDLGPESLELHYFSERKGLAPFVVGLLRGVGIMFKTKVLVEKIAPDAQAADHDVFLVQWSPLA